MYSGTCQYVCIYMYFCSWRAWWGKVKRSSIVLSWVCGTFVQFVQSFASLCLLPPQLKVWQLSLNIVKWITKMPSDNMIKLKLNFFLCHVKHIKTNNRNYHVKNIFSYYFYPDFTKSVQLTLSLQTIFIRSKASI